MDWRSPPQEGVYRARVPHGVWENDIPLTGARLLDEVIEIVTMMVIG
jgi:hypothetical protein